jgi:hypothetical protein
MESYTNFNESLDASHIDVSPKDQSMTASVVRTMTSSVAKVFSPRSVIILLRLLKAVTFVLLSFTIVANLTFIFVLESLSDEIISKVGGNRERMMRLYAVVLAFLAILIELDIAVTKKHWSGLKGFFPRSLFLYMISVMTASAPIIHYERVHNRSSKSDDDYGSYGGHQYYNKNKYSYGSNTSSSTLISSELHGGPIWMQGSAAFFLSIAALVYFFLGLLCFDRFTSKAFLATDESGIEYAGNERYDYDEEDGEVV